VRALERSRAWSSAGGDFRSRPGIENASLPRNDDGSSPGGGIGSFQIVVGCLALLVVVAVVAWGLWKVQRKTRPESPLDAGKTRDDR
jgi:hypothetical protein